MEKQSTKQIIPSTQVRSPEPQEDTIDLIELFYRLLAGWKLIAALSIAGAVIFGVITVFCISPKYKATATIYVLSNKESAINMSDLQMGAALTNDYVKVFDMWEVHEQVITNLGLPYTYSQMSSMLSVKNIANTRMLDITVTSTDPSLAASIANEYATVASNFIADTMSTDKPNIVSTALVPANPFSPSKSKNVVIGFAAGFMLACLIIFIKMMRDDTYKTADDIMKYTGLATLAIIPVSAANMKQTPSYKQQAKKEKKLAQTEKITKEGMKDE